MFKIYTTESGLKYEVHNNGDIYSLRGNRKKLKQQTTTNGYKTINLGDKNRGVSVHRLIGELFVNGESEHNNIINHIDGNKTNNDYTNLEWCSYSHNSLHSISKLGKTLNRRLSDDTINELINDYNNTDINIKQISSKYGIGISTARRILCGAEYKSVNGKNKTDNRAEHKKAKLIPQGVKEMIVKLRGNGLSYGAISKELGISKFTVAKELGWKRKNA